jgi:hypothetical protein
MPSLYLAVPCRWNAGFRFRPHPSGPCGWGWGPASGCARPSPLRIRQSGGPRCWKGCTSRPGLRRYRRRPRSTLPVQGTRMIWMSVGYCSRIEPARSAAVYPQKLQQKAMMIGSKSSPMENLPALFGWPRPPALPGERAAFRCLPSHARTPSSSASSLHRICSSSYQFSSMALAGHSEAQIPHPWHRAGSISETPSRLIRGTS